MCAARTAPWPAAARPVLLPEHMGIGPGGGRDRVLALAHRRHLEGCPSCMNGPLGWVQPAGSRTEAPDSSHGTIPSTITRAKKPWNFLRGDCDPGGCGIAREIPRGPTGLQALAGVQDSCTLPPGISPGR